MTFSAEDIIHGHARKHAETPTYKTWLSMKQRCNNPNNTRFHCYGGRGIKVCDRWQDYQNFLLDMGERPRNSSIERLNNDDGYNPSNCKWAIRREQDENRRGTVFLTLDGKTDSIGNWSRDRGIDKKTLWSRVKRYGWSDELALTVPAKRGNRLANL